jgi:DNA-binding PadR family transcriptional regulator
VAKRRRVNSLLALALLSTVVQRPMHPYEIASVMRARNKDQDMQIKWGSLYTVVRNLSRHGLIEPTEANRQGNRPERTIYRITQEGRAELEDWARELVSVPETEHPRFEAGLSVLGILSPDEVIGLLEVRLSLLTEENARKHEALENYRQELPRLFLVEMEYEIAIREAETEWVRALLSDLRSGEMPGLSRWREWHAAADDGLQPLAQQGGADS